MFRLLTAAAFLGTMAISAYYRRRARAATGTIARRSESALLIAGRLVVALPLFVAVLLYVAAPRWMGWASLPSIPEWARWIGAGLALASVRMAFWVFRSLGHNVSETVVTKDDHSLVTHGPYRWIRHPLYTTGLMLFFGVGLMNRSWFVLVISTVALVAILAVVIPQEEGELVERFGAEYRDLVRRTGRLLPRIGPFS